MNKTPKYTSPLLSTSARKQSKSKPLVNPSTQQTHKKQPLFIIRIDVGDNKFEDLKFYEGDNSQNLAAKFGKKFGLNDEAIGILAQQLSSKVEDETAKKQQQQQILREKIKQDIQDELKQQKSSRRSKSRLQSQRQSNLQNCTAADQAVDSGNLSMVNQQPAHDRLYNIAMTKNQKQKQLQEQQEAGSNGKSLNSTQKCKTARSFMKQNSTSNQNLLSASKQRNNNNNNTQSIMLQNMNSSTIGGSSSTTYINNNVNYSGGFGDRMYLQHTRKKELFDINPMEDFQNKQIQDFITYHPQKHSNKQSFVASHSSSMICGDRFFNRTEEILLDWGKKYNDRKVKLAEEREEEIKQECKFQPQLDEKRLQKYLKQDGSRSLKDIHSFLFEEDKARNQKLKDEQYKQEEDLKKQANRVSISKERAVQVVEEITNRLTNLNQRKKWFEEKSLERQRYETKVDIETGQELFKPKLNFSARKEKNDHNKFVLQHQKNNKENKLGINEILYLESKVIKERKEQLKQSYMNQSRDEIKLSNKSQKMIENRQRNSLQELFWALDSDNDGLISSDKIDLGQLSNKALDILTNFLVSMEERRLVLDFETFLILINQVLQNLSLVDRDELLAPKQKVKEIKNHHSFKPQISERSHKLANKRSQSRGDLTEYLTRPLSSKRSQANTNNQSVYSEFENLQGIESRELKDCTFKPNISKKSLHLGKLVKEREISGCSSRQDAIHKDFQPLIDRKNQELQFVMKKTINLRIDQ
ncbi:UNKNOWN [Stylonychia lemnae]|uniref:EF-hand domain-containing protein n=1 Tax=Stylonychia lemnae TaxID=5949 RepID=A0A078APG6_STYLE|nr:UNKNOWN [Stylonychia lemnae]|eukprot:CDW83846.1 UNKNOWN [Stylonychia lemnae]